MNIRPSMSVLLSAALVMLSAVAVAQSTQPARQAGALPTTQPTSAPSTQPANSILTDQTAVPLTGHTLPSVPNATLCSVRGWADQTKEYEVSRQILAAGATDAGPSKATRTPPGRQASTPAESDPLKLVRPICSAADIEGLTSTDLIDGVFRSYSKEDYLRFAQRKDRPLIVNWIEDYPKILAAQCEHWGFPATMLAPASLQQFDLSVLRPNAANEFEFHRLEEQYAKLETQRGEILSRNLHVGPAPSFKEPVLLVMRAKLAEYDFAAHRYELTVPMVRGAVSLKEYLKAPGEAFDACVVLMGAGHRWESAYLPLAEAPAEKLRKENADVILIVEGYVYYPNRTFAASGEAGLARSVFMYISRVTCIAVPENQPLYQVAVFETGDKAGRY